MRKKRKFKSSNLIVVLICLSVCFISLFFFWKNLNKMTDRSDINKIGTIQYKYKIAQRKFIDRVAWERLQQNSAVYNGDTIRTADRAAAIIIIADTTIQISESTMIQVFYNPDTGLNLSVDNGDISVDTTAASKNVSVNLANGNNFVLETGSKIRAQTGEVQNIVVQSGIVSYVDEKGQTAAINGGETVKVSSSGTVEKVPVSITSISDNMKLLAFKEDSKNVLLEWSLSDVQTSPVVVETYADKELTVKKEVHVVEKEKSLNLTVPVGRTYWKAYLQDNKENYVSGKIVVDKPEPVKLINPAFEKEYSTRNGTSDVTFSWKGNEYVSYYLFEVSSSPDFSKPLISQQAYASNYRCSNLGEGNYYWRVTPFYTVNNIGYGESTDSSAFKISKMQFEKPPVLSVPADNARITVSEKASDLNFIWKTFTENSDYKILVSKDNSFANIVYSQESSSGNYRTQVTSSSLGEGDYYWKVVSLKDSGEDGKLLESPVRKFTAVKYIPGENKLVYPPDNYSVEAKKIKTVDFCWKIAEENKASLENTSLQISKNRDFGTLELSKSISGKNQISNIELGAGNYWWRIAVKTEGSDTVYSSPNLFHVLEDLQKPVITAPSGNVILQRDNTINLKWSKVSGADYYLVKVFDSKNTFVNQTVKNQELTFSLSQSLFESHNSVDLKCSVQAFASETEYSQLRSGEISEANFTALMPSKLKLKSPADSSGISGLAALKAPVKFEWEGTEGAKDVQFILKKMQPSGEMKVIRSVTNAGSSVSISELRAGSYEWIVKANSAGGIKIDAEKAFAFTILPVPELSIPRLTMPSPDQIIDSDYLFKNQAVSFKWNAVSNATDYQFVLYQKLSDGKLKKLVSKSTKKTEFIISDLTILDIGEFEWHVTAYIHSSTGEQEQKSRDSVGKFQILFGEPDEVETIDPGIMYGE